MCVGSFNLEKGKRGRQGKKEDRKEGKKGKRKGEEKTGKGRWEKRGVWVI